MMETREALEMPPVVTPDQRQARREARLELVLIGSSDRSRAPDTMTPWLSHTLSGWVFSSRSDGLRTGMNSNYSQVSLASVAELVGHTGWPDHDIASSDF